jgi:integrase
VTATAPSRQEIERLVASDLTTLGLCAAARTNWYHVLGLLLDWLEAAGEGTWQDRWQSSGAEAAADWPALAGATKVYERVLLPSVLQTLLCHRLIRPGYPWLLRQPFDALGKRLHALTDHGDLERLFAAAETVGVHARRLSLIRMTLARMLVHTGKRLGELTTADFVVYGQAWRAAGRPSDTGIHTAHQLLCRMGIISDPPLIAAFHHRTGPQTAAELVARRQIACQPIGDLLVRYLTERTAGLDHKSLCGLEQHLVRSFWCDLERHHPGIASLHLPRDVAQAWRERARSQPDGRRRRDVGALLLAVRAFYLDLAQWAAEDPATWGPWVAPCPVSAADLRGYAKHKHHRRARMHARIRTLAPALPALLASTRRRLQTASELLAAASAAAEDETIVVDGRRYRRLPADPRETTGRGVAGLRVQALDEPGQPTRNCRLEEDDAFWSWAIIEVLRLTGVRCEELLELTHLSIRHHRTRDGQLVVLLQIAPSKTDRERVIPVCPELAHALARIVERIRGDQPTVPTIARWGIHEKVASVALPYLFQRTRGGNRVPLTRHGLVGAINRAVAHAGLRDVDGDPLVFRPHDFRRLFATDAVNGGLPVHIAAKLLGHLDLNTTQGYVAVYPEQVIRHVQAHVTRQRALRPSEEYREPSQAEWAEFEQHFRRRKMALGTATGPTAPTAPTSTPACAARCCAWTPCNSHGCWRLSRTPTGCSPRRASAAGTARPPVSRPPCSTSPRRRPRSTGSRPPAPQRPAASRSCGCPSALPHQSRPRVPLSRRRSAVNGAQPPRPTRPGRRGLAAAGLHNPGCGDHGPRSGRPRLGVPAAVFEVGWGSGGCGSW